MCACVCAVACAWRSEVNLLQSVLSFYLVVFRDQTLVPRLGDKYLYPLSYLLGCSS